jgi:hypothetical protein
MRSVRKSPTEAGAKAKGLHKPVAFDPNTSTYRCTNCGGAIDEVRVAYALRSRNTPQSCGRKCSNASKNRRYRARLQQRALGVAA